MMSLNTLRTKFGVVLSIVIGGALLAFIFSLKNDVGFSGNDPEVGEVNGKDVNYFEFSKAYEDVRTLYGGNNAEYDQSAQFVAQAWQSILADRVLVPAFEDLGLTVTEAEHADMKAGKVPSGIYASLFTDAQTGAYSIDNVNAFID
jgi:peptidyl-prolyl cis-trans isomerase D